MFYKHADRILLGSPEHRDRALQQPLGEIGFRNEKIQDSGIREMYVGNLVITYLQQVPVTGKISIDSIRSGISQKFQTGSIVFARFERHFEDRVSQGLVVFIHHDARLESLHIDSLGILDHH